MFFKPVKVTVNYKDSSLHNLPIFRALQIRNDLWYMPLGVKRFKAKVSCLIPMIFLKFSKLRVPLLLHSMFCEYVNNLS